MKKGLETLARFWRRGRISLILAAVLVVAVIFIGLQDIGLVLGYAATTIVMLEIVRRWRKIRYFLILFLASLLGIIFLAFVHEELAKPLVTWLLGPGAVNGPGFRLFSDIISLAMIFPGVIGIVTGLAGAATLGVWRLATGKSKRSTGAT